MRQLPGAPKTSRPTDPRQLCPKNCRLTYECPRWAATHAESHWELGILDLLSGFVCKSPDLAQNSTLPESGILNIWPVARTYIALVDVNYQGVSQEMAVSKS